MNRIYFGDNLPILETLPDESVDLIYIDPPFNTGKKQSRTRIKTVQSHSGDRKGFNGKYYTTVELGTKAYQDRFTFDTDGVVSDELAIAYRMLLPESSVFFLEGFLRPRLMEAYRLLKPNGSLYFHIDYREVHYCKLLLDRIFGRDSFVNEIIWAYDFGGRARGRWPAKHDNILYYVKDPKKFIFNPSEVEREKYMAPGLVGPEKAARGKMPTDTWWWPYVGKMQISDTWWMTIVGTNSKERVGYPTQKPYKLIDRIVQASSFQGNVVLDFFAGSGSVGESCLRNKREFILIDNNIEALEVMAQRFSGFDDIEWINFNPKPYQTIVGYIFEELHQRIDNDIPNFDHEMQQLASIAASLQSEFENKNDLWKSSPFEWIVGLPARSKSKFARNLLLSWLTSKGLKISRVKDSSETIIVYQKKFAIKFSTLWEGGIYQFQQIKEDGPEYIICFGISPFNAHIWIITKESAIKHGNKQHKGAGAEYWLSINPANTPEWLIDCGGTLIKAFEKLEKFST